MNRHQQTIGAHRRAARLKAAKAHRTVSKALKKGLLVQGRCEVCFAGSTEAHHDDYDRPLDVRWLCRRHHQEAYR